MTVFEFVIYQQNQTKPNTLTQQNHGVTILLVASAALCTTGALFPPYFCLCTAKRDHKSILIKLVFGFSVEKFGGYNLEPRWYASLAITHTATRGR